MKLHLLLADDDVDDIDFFKDALDEIESNVQFSFVKNGVELMSYLTSDESPKPDLLFLDLNMPKKSGIECIDEIKANDTINQIPIMVFSTSLDKMVVDDLYASGAERYIQKPGEFSNLKKVIKKAIDMYGGSQTPPRSREEFIIQP